MRLHTSQKASEKGNAVVIVLVALVIVAVGALAYLATQKGESGKVETTAAEPAAGESAEKPQAGAEQQAAPQIEIKDPEGDPVVAKIKGRDIKRSEVFVYMQNLAPNVRQLPLDQLFALSVNQLINTQLTEAKAQSAKLNNDPAVKAQLEAAKRNIVRNVFVQKEVQKAMTDERLQAAYEVYKANYPQIEEVKSRHILVEEEANAKALLKQIKDGADFAEIAKEHSIDSTKATGGELGFISKQSPVLPEYIEALFSAGENTLISKPVKSQAGFHIIETLGKRTQPVPDFERVKTFLAGQISNEVLNEVLAKWREQADVVVLDINGEPLEKAVPEAQDAAPAAESSAAETPAAAPETAE